MTLTMNLRTNLSAPSILLATTLLMSSCTFWHDTVSFDAAGKMPAAKTPVPKIEIDTNISITTLFGGFVKSNKPYDIHAYLMDGTSTFDSAEFTSVTVTYADGTLDPGLAALKLPMRSQHTIHESYNSMGEDGIVVTRSRIIRAEFPDVISRDEPFTLLLKGRFIKSNGSIIPFVIKEKYDPTRDKRTESWADFVSGC
jgi:hypothetical protein